MTNKEAIEFGKQWLKDCEVVNDEGTLDDDIAFMNLAIKALENEIPKGEWIKKVDDVGFVSYICSECGFELELEDCSDSYYCTICGANMRGDKK